MPVFADRHSAQSFMLSLMQDYARLHSYKVIATSAVADPSLDNMWNKVGWLLKAYHVRALPFRHDATFPLP